MRANELWVRLHDETIGPVSAAEIRELARIGRIGPDTSVSADGQRWLPASKIKGLVFGAASAGTSQQEMAPRARATDGKKRGQNREKDAARAHDIVHEVLTFVDLCGGETPPPVTELIELKDLAVPAILRAVTEVRPGEDTSAEFQNRARLCRVLGEIGTDDCLQALKKIVTLYPNLWEYSEYVRPAAIEALERCQARVSAAGRTLDHRPENGQNAPSARREEQAAKWRGEDKFSREDSLAKSASSSDDDEFALAPLDDEHASRRELERKERERWEEYTRQWEEAESDEPYELAAPDECEDGDVQTASQGRASPNLTYDEMLQMMLASLASAGISSAGSLKCDICGRPISQSEMTTVEPSAIVRATAAGFVPNQLPFENIFLAQGRTRQEVWLQTVERNRSNPWGLCSRCAANVGARVQS